MLRGSSILFSGSFASRGDFYLKNDFINKIYYYYLNRGLSNIVLNEVVSVLISSFTLSLVEAFNVFNGSNQKLALFTAKKGGIPEEDIKLGYSIGSAAQEPVICPDKSIVPDNGLTYARLY